MSTHPHVDTGPRLRVDHLSVRYGGEGRDILGADDVSLTIAPGEVLGLAGESGSGKSTVANAIMRLLRPPAQITGGTVTFRDQDVLALRGEELRRFRWSEIAMVFQSAMNSLNPVMTVGDQIVDVYTAHGRLDRRAARDRAVELLELVGIPADRLDSYPHQLSGGMRQRVVIAIALTLDPQLLILDEPTTALDVVVQQEIMQQIQSLQADRGFAVLFITHDISLMVEMSHRMAVMHSGRIVESGPSDQILDEPLHPYTAALMGAFPPITGPRVHLTGLGERTAGGGALGFDPRNIPDLAEVSPGRWVAPVDGTGHRRTEGAAR
jgi:peptide/nickel transport system ATP-binding protein